MKRSPILAVAILLIGGLGLGAVTNIASEWIGGVQRFYIQSTGETVHVNAPTWHSDDFTGIALDSTNDWNVSGVNSGTAAINSATSGTMRITTGAADDDDVEVASELIYKASKGVSFEARVAQNDVDATGLCLGLTDAKTEAADLLAVTFNTGDAVVSTASDFAGWFQDPDATTDDYRAVAVIADTDGTTITTSSTPADGAYHIFRVDIDADGDCDFWLDGVHQGTESTGITTTDALCAYIGLINRESAANTADVDYVRVWQNSR